MVVELSLSWTAENIHVVPPSQTINAFAFNDRVAFSHQNLFWGIYAQDSLYSSVHLYCERRTAI